MKSEEFSSRFFYLIILIDLLLRLSEFTWFYGESGVWPLRHAFYSNFWSEFPGQLFSLPIQFTAGLFALAVGLLLFGMIKGTTALTSVALAVTITLINHRNHWILDAGDGFMIKFLYWHALFKFVPKSRTAWVQYAFGLQLFLIYIENGLLKNGPTWTEWGTALNIIWGQEYISQNWSQFIARNYDLKWLTFFARYAELIIPFLLLFRKYKFPVFFFVIYHFVIACSVKIELFAWINIAGWLLLWSPPEGNWYFSDLRTRFVKFVAVSWLLLGYLQGVNILFLKYEIPAKTRNIIGSLGLIQHYRMFTPDPRFTNYRYTFICLKNEKIIPCSKETIEWENTANWGRRRKQFLIKTTERKAGAPVMHKGLQGYLCSINPEIDAIKISIEASVTDLKNPQLVKRTNIPWPLGPDCHRDK